jgi:hypothetical protein
VTERLELRVEGPSRRAGFLSQTQSITSHLAIDAMAVADGSRAEAASESWKGSEDIE